MNPANYVRKIVYINGQLNGFASYSPMNSLRRLKQQKGPTRLG